MKKVLKKYFVPHPENDHKPHFLRLETVLGLLVGILSVEALFLATIFIVFPNTSFFASLIPDVLIDLTNNNRTSDNLVLLTTNPLLTEAAQLKANDMATKGYFAHTSPEGVTPWYWLNEAGYSYTRAGENLAVDFSDSQDVVTAWMNSPSHRANIENGNFTEIGIATAKGMFNGHETTFVVQFFGKPTFVIPAIPKSESETIPTVIPEVVVVTPEPVSEPEQVAGAVIIPEDPIFRDSAVTVITSESEQAGPVPMVVGAAAPEARSSWVERTATAPRATANVILWSFLTVIITALVLAVAIKIRIQHPQIILHGVLLILVVSSLILANSVFAGESLRIQ